MRYTLERLLVFFSKFIPTGMRFLVIKGPLRGFKWITGAAVGEAKGLSVLLNLAEPFQMDLAKKIAPKNGICFDIGANVGLYTLLFARYSRIVYAFEPFPRNICYLVKTLEINNVNNAIIVPCAVSDKNGLFWFKEGLDYSTGKLSNEGQQPVTTVSLDEFVEKGKIIPNILKIDVEGAEFQVIMGAKNLLLKHKPILLLSTHGEEVKKKCLHCLKKMNYHINPINANSIDNASEFLIKPYKFNFQNLSF